MQGKTALRPLCVIAFVAWPGERNPPAEPSQPKNEERYDQRDLQLPESGHSDRSDRREQLEGTPANLKMKMLEFPDTPELRGISFNQHSANYYHGKDGGSSELRQRRGPWLSTPYASASHAGGVRRDTSLDAGLHTPAPTWHTPTPSRQYYQPEWVQSPYLQASHDHMVQQAASAVCAFVAGTASTLNRS